MTRWIWATIATAARRWRTATAAGGEGATGEDGGGATGPCAAACGRLGSCGFVTAAEEAKCNADCGVMSTTLRSCIEGGDCANVATCYAAIIGADPTGGFAAQACKEECDTANFFDCIDAADHAYCRSLCDSKPNDVRTTFTRCAESASTCSERQDCCAQLAR